DHGLGPGCGLQNAAATIIGHKNRFAASRLRINAEIVGVMHFLYVAVDEQVTAANVVHTHQVFLIRLFDDKNSGVERTDTGTVKVIRGPLEGEVHRARLRVVRQQLRSEEHTSELQSRENLVCRLLLEK